MTATEYNRGKAFTLVELMMTVLIAAIIVLAAGVMMVDSLKGYNKMYERVNEGIVRDAYISRITFDKRVRRSTWSKVDYETSGEGAYVRVYYYSTPTSPLDRYSEFHRSGEQLLVTHGTYDEESDTLAPLTTIVLANHVEDVVFDVADGARVSMVLSLNDGVRRMSVMTSAVRHNE